MAIAPAPARIQPTADQPDERPAALTPRGQAAALLIRLEDLWPSLDAADRAWLDGTLEDLAREAAVAR